MRTLTIVVSESVSEREAERHSTSADAILVADQSEAA